MAATNYTPIQLYHSTTASAAPTAGNLTDGELAINIADGKLFYKDSGGAVQVIATKGTGTIGGSNTQVQYNSSGALAGSANFTFNGTTATINTLNLTNALLTTYGGTGLSSYTAGDMLYYASGTALSKLAVGTNGYILTSNGSAPTWTAPSSIVVSTATNLAGGAAGSVPYQSALDTTTFLAIGAANRVMTSSGSAPQWVTSLTGLTGVSSSAVTNTSLTSGRVVYSTTGGAQTDSTNLTFNGTTLTAGGLSTGGSTSLTKLVTVGGSSFTLPSALSASAPAKLYVSTGGVTDGSSAIGATNALGAIVSLGSTSVDATNTSVTYTNLATLYIADAPAAGTNITITNPYAMYIASGASYFGGNVSLANNPTLSGGTANGVLYLNGSKVATSGSALTFDGTVVNNTGSAPSFRSTITGGTYYTNLSPDGIYASGTDLYLFAPSGKFVSFYANGSEQMRLTSTSLYTASGINVGIGTSSPSGIGRALNVYGAAGDVSTVIAEGDAGNKFLALYSGSASNDNGAIYSNQSIRFGYATSKAAAGYTNLMTLDTSGNLGLGVTPSAWYPSVYTVMDVGASSAFGGYASGASGDALTFVAGNVYYNSSNNPIYKKTGLATNYRQFNGVHQWYNAPSGTAGDAITFTQAMTLDANGTLLVGTTTSNSAFKSVVYNTNASYSLGLKGDTYGLRFLGTSSAYRIEGVDNSLVASYNPVVVGAGGYLAFETGTAGGGSLAERARIDSSGNLLVGQTSTTSPGDGNTTDGTAIQSIGKAYFSCNTGRGLTLNRNEDGAVAGFFRSGTQVGSISVTTSATAYNTSSDYRLKDNPQPLTGSGAFIDALQPKTWNWKADGSRGVGFIAHEVQEVSPGSVVGEKDGEQMQAMEYGSAEFIANIIAELQSLRKRLADAGIA